MFGPTLQVHTTQPEFPHDTPHATGRRISQARHPNFDKLVITNLAAIDMQQPRIPYPSTAKSTSPCILNRCGDLQTHFCDPWYEQAKSHHAGYVRPARASCVVSSTFSIGRHCRPCGYGRISPPSLYSGRGGSWFEPLQVNSANNQDNELLALLFDQHPRLPCTYFHRRVHGYKPLTQ
jgi:hypothetical protein